MKLCLTVAFWLAIVQITGFVRSTEIRQIVPIGFPCVSIGQSLAQLDCDVILDCSKSDSSPYRNVNGTCNNLVNRKWGSRATNFARFVEKRNILDPGDDMIFRVQLPSGEIHNLPHARTVSAWVHDGNDTKAAQASLLLMQIGQIIDHDLTLTSEATLCNLEPCHSMPEPVDCCEFFLSPGKYNMTRPSLCWPMPIPKDDPFYKPEIGRNPPKCLDFTRSMRTPCGDREEQFNEVTHLLDGSAFYGSTQGKTDLLREGKGGRLRVKGPGLLPFEVDTCKKPDRDGNPAVKSSFIAGDVRVNENPGLQAIHMLWLDEHNRLARELEKAAPGRPDEEIYQETRRYVVAEWQNIVYKEFLPVILGSKLVSQFDLDSNPSLYDPRVRPTIFQEFSTAAYRFGHSMIQNQINLLEADLTLESENLFDNFFNTKIMTDNKYENMIRGMTRQRAGQVDSVIVTAVRNFLFKPKQEFFGGDLVAKNIQRGRDHKIGSYNQVRIQCGLKPLPKTFAPTEKPAELSSEIWLKLSKVYGFPEDIDLFPGGMSENPAPGGGLVGPTFGCIIASQFHNLKFGDRYFYSHNNVHPRVKFCAKSLETIGTRTLRDVLCDNLNLDTLQLNVLKVAHNESNPFVSCSIKHQLLPSGLCLFGLYEDSDEGLAQTRPQLKSKSLIAPPEGDEVVVLTGGFDGERILDSVEVYAPDGQCNFYLAPLPKPVYDHFTIFYRGRLFACGGNTNTICWRYIQGSQPGNQSWVEYPAMKLHEARRMAAIATSPTGIVYVSGGTQTQTTIEYLDPKFDDYTWRLKNRTKNILAGKFRHCLVALPDERLVSIGGSGSGNSIEIYNPFSDEWTPMRNISYIDRHTCLLLSEKKILIVGGDLSGWILDLENNNIQMTKNTPEIRRGFSTLHRLNGKIFVFGGTFSPSLVEEFRVDTSTFQRVPISLLHNRSRFGSTVVPASFFRHFTCNPKNST